MISILSLVTSIKDYVEIVHKLIETDNSFGRWSGIQTLIPNYFDLGSIMTYTLISFKEFLTNFISLNWFWKIFSFFPILYDSGSVSGNFGLSYNSIWSLPIVIPDINSAMISEISVLDGYFHNTFNFLDKPISYGDTNITIYSLEKFSIGLINSLFLCLPTGTTHLITLRRFVMQGLEAGYLAGLGSICGNILWISSIIFGFRFFVVPWLSLDLFRYVLGFICLIKYMWDSYNEKGETSNLKTYPVMGQGFAGPKGDVLTSQVRSNTSPNQMDNLSLRVGVDVNKQDFNGGVASFSSPPSSLLRRNKKEKNKEQKNKNLVRNQKIFLLNFLLALTEQTSIYPFMTNISIGSESSLLESFPAQNNLEFLSIHGSYILGLSIGCLSFLHLTCWFWENPAFKFYMWLDILTRMGKLLTSPFYFLASLAIQDGGKQERYSLSPLGDIWGKASHQNQRHPLWGTGKEIFGEGTSFFYYKILNFIFLYLTMICAISSIPYYGLDYTLTNPLGFIQEDRILDQKLILETSFLNTKASDRNTRRNRGRHGRRERWKRRIRKYRTFDASLYDQGIYDLFTIEDLNYGFDRFWLRRKMRNHRVRFRFFPGPWMRSFKKQLAKPRLESYAGPRQEFFRILFEQVYHPSFHEYLNSISTVSQRGVDRNTYSVMGHMSHPFLFLPSASSPPSESSLLLLRRNKKEQKKMEISREEGRGDFPSGSKEGTLRFSQSGSLSVNPVKTRERSVKNRDVFYHKYQRQLSTIAKESSTLRKFVRKLNNRTKRSEILSNLKGRSFENRSLSWGESSVYSKRWKENFSFLLPSLLRRNKMERRRMFQTKILHGQSRQVNKLLCTPFDDNLTVGQSNTYSVPFGDINTYPDYISMTPNLLRDNIAGMSLGFSYQKEGPMACRIKDITRTGSTEAILKANSKISLSKLDKNILKYRSILAAGFYSPYTELLGTFKGRPEVKNGVPEVNEEVWTSDIKSSPPPNITGWNMERILQKSSSKNEKEGNISLGGNTLGGLPSRRSLLLMGQGYAGSVGNVPWKILQHKMERSKKEKINTSLYLLHPIKFYLKKQQAFERKLRYYTPTIFRKFAIENNAPYFRVMMKRYFYYFKPTLRWERTMKVASLRKARRKTPVSPRKIQLSQLSPSVVASRLPHPKENEKFYSASSPPSFLLNLIPALSSSSPPSYSCEAGKKEEKKKIPPSEKKEEKEQGKEKKEQLQKPTLPYESRSEKEEQDDISLGDRLISPFATRRGQGHPTKSWNGDVYSAARPHLLSMQKFHGWKEGGWVSKNSRVIKTTHNYTIIGKRASRFRYEIYKDVLQHWYYSPFNRLLLKFDIDLFINRQPKSHFLTKNEEKLLHLRRFLLSEHYNTLRWYSYMQHYRSMKNKIGGTKSFASKVYNQQFSGTFKKIRHLFAITPSQSDQPVLKFDQPLYNESSVVLLRRRKAFRDDSELTILSSDTRSKIFGEEAKNKGPVVAKAGTIPLQQQPGRGERRDNLYFFDPSSPPSSLLRRNKKEEEKKDQNTQRQVTHKKRNISLDIFHEELYVPDINWKTSIPKVKESPITLGISANLNRQANDNPPPGALAERDFLRSFPVGTGQFLPGRRGQIMTGDLLQKSTQTVGTYLKKSSSTKQYYIKNLIKNKNYVKLTQFLYQGQKTRGLKPITNEHRFLNQEKQYLLTDLYPTGSRRKIQYFQRVPSESLPSSLLLLLAGDTQEKRFWNRNKKADVAPGLPQKQRDPKLRSKKENIRPLLKDRTPIFASPTPGGEGNIIRQGMSLPLKQDLWVTLLKKWKRKVNDQEFLKNYLQRRIEKREKRKKKKEKNLKIKLERLENWDVKALRIINSSYLPYTPWEVFSLSNPPPLRGAYDRGEKEDNELSLVPPNVGMGEVFVPILPAAKNPLIFSPTSSSSPPSSPPSSLLLLRRFRNRNKEEKKKKGMSFIRKEAFSVPGRVIKSTTGLNNALIEGVYILKSTSLHSIFFSAPSSFSPAPSSSSKKKIPKEEKEQKNKKQDGQIAQQKGKNFKTSISRRNQESPGNLPPSEDERKEKGRNSHRRWKKAKKKKNIWLTLLREERDRKNYKIWQQKERSLNKQKRSRKEFKLFTQRMTPQTRTGVSYGVQNKNSNFFMRLAKKSDLSLNSYYASHQTISGDNKGMYLDPEAALPLSSNTSRRGVLRSKNESLNLKKKRDFFPDTRLPYPLLSIFGGGSLFIPALSSPPSYSCSLRSKKKILGEEAGKKEDKKEQERRSEKEDVNKGRNGTPAGINIGQKRKKRDVGLAPSSPCSLRSKKEIFFLAQQGEEDSARMKEEKMVGHPQPEGENTSKKNETPANAGVSLPSILFLRSRNGNEKNRVIFPTGHPNGERHSQEGEVLAKLKNKFFLFCSAKFGILSRIGDRFVSPKGLVNLTTRKFKRKKSPQRRARVRRNRGVTKKRTLSDSLKREFKNLRKYGGQTKLTIRKKSFDPGVNSFLTSLPIEDGNKGHTSPLSSKYLKKESSLGKQELVLYHKNISKERFNNSYYEAMSKIYLSLGGLSYATTNGTGVPSPSFVPPTGRTKNLAAGRISSLSGAFLSLPAKLLDFLPHWGEVFMSRTPLLSSFARGIQHFFPSSNILKKEHFPGGAGLPFGMIKKSVIFRQNALLLQRRSKQKKQRFWKQKRSKYSQKLRKYKKRRRSVLGKVRILTKQLKRIQSTTELKNWWWKKFLPNLRATTDSLLQFEKDRQIKQKLLELTVPEIPFGMSHSERDKIFPAYSPPSESSKKEQNAGYKGSVRSFSNLAYGVQIGDFDFKPLSMPASPPSQGNNRPEDFYGGEYTLREKTRSELATPHVVPLGSESLDTNNTFFPKGEVPLLLIPASSSSSSSSPCYARKKISAPSSSYSCSFGERAGKKKKQEEENKKEEEQEQGRRRKNVQPLLPCSFFEEGGGEETAAHFLQKGIRSKGCEAEKKDVALFQVPESRRKIQNEKTLKLPPSGYEAKKEIRNEVFTNSGPYQKEVAQNLHQKSAIEYSTSSGSLPFYAGWDNSLRKFVVTNRLLSRRTSGYEVNKYTKSLLQSKKETNDFPPLAKMPYISPRDRIKVFSEAPLKGMNAATTLYWQIPFTTYDPDQFFALGMDGFAPLGWRRFQFRHSILKSWLHLRERSKIHDLPVKNGEVSLAYNFLQTPTHTVNPLFVRRHLIGSSDPKGETSPEGDVSPFGIRHKEDRGMGVVRYPSFILASSPRHGTPPGRKEAKKKSSSPPSFLLNLLLLAPQEKRFRFRSKEKKEEQGKQNVTAQPNNFNLRESIPAKKIKLEGSKSVSRNIYRRLKKRYKRVKKHPRSPVWFPSGPLLNQVLPVHYIYIFYKRSRLPRDRYIKRRLRKSKPLFKDMPYQMTLQTGGSLFGKTINTFSEVEPALLMSSHSKKDKSQFGEVFMLGEGYLPVKDFTLRKRIKTKRKYHIKPDFGISSSKKNNSGDLSPLIPRRLKFLGTSTLRWRPLSRQKINKPISELIKEQRALKYKQRKKNEATAKNKQSSANANLRIKQLRRRVQRQIIRSVWRYNPRAGGFVWPGDYLKLEQVKAPRLKYISLSSLRMRRDHTYISAPSSKKEEKKKSSALAEKEKARFDTSVTGLPKEEEGTGTASTSRSFSGFNSPTGGKKGSAGVSIPAKVKRKKKRNIQEWQIQPKKYLLEKHNLNVIKKKLEKANRSPYEVRNKNLLKKEM